MLVFISNFFFASFCIFTISPYDSLTISSLGNKISDFCTISPGCHLTGWVTLGANVFLGVGASLIPHVTLGDNVYVAAGAVVVKSFDSGRLIGVPAQVKTKKT